MDVRKRLAAGVVRLRKEKGWSQEELADRAGVHRTYVSGVERCVRNPTIVVVAKLSAGLECTIGELVDEPPELKLRPDLKRGRSL